MIVKHNVGFKTSATGHIRASFYGDLVYKFKGKPPFPDQFKKIIKRLKKWDITWALCGSLYAWFNTQSQLYIAIFSVSSSKLI